MAATGRMKARGNRSSLFKEEEKNRLRLEKRGETNKLPKGLVLLLKKPKEQLGFSQERKLKLPERKWLKKRLLIRSLKM